MHQGLEKFVAEFLSVHTQNMGASDLNMAAATARAIANSTGTKLLGVYSVEEYQKLIDERIKGKSLGKN